MSDLAELTKIDGIAVVTISNPPVNALSSAVAAGIAAAVAVAQIEKDDSVKAVVFIGAGRTFVAGADIKEFGELTSGKIICRESLKPLLERIEDLRKPVVMAIHGTEVSNSRWPDTTVLHCPVLRLASRK
jgi:3-hydroxyacyl-CoA dehydrogenase